jgi:serine/threonine-protein kinase HipA
MARRPARTPLEIYLNGRLVGRLRRESSGAVDFQYHGSWLGWNNAIPVSVSLPLREDRYIGESVLAVFDNLLPDNEAIRRRLAERSQAEGSDTCSLLAAVGRDCVGALQFLPEGMDPGKPGAIDARAVDDAEVASIVSNLAQNPLGVGDDKEFRISLAGAQETTALLLLNNKWHVPHGTTATTHIIKPQIGKLPNGIDLSNSVENEHYSVCRSPNHKSWILPEGASSRSSVSTGFGHVTIGSCVCHRKIAVRRSRSRLRANTSPKAAPAFPI